MRHTYSLMQDTLESLHGHAGDEVEVVRGAIWLTLGGEDIVLGRGQRYRLPRSGQLVLQAMTPAQVTLRQQARTPLFAWLEAWRERAAAG